MVLWKHITPLPFTLEIHVEIFIALQRKYPRAGCFCYKNIYLLYEIPHNLFYVAERSLRAESICYCF